MVNYEKNPIGTALQHVYSLARTDASDAFRQRVGAAIQTVEQCFDKYRYLYLVHQMSQNFRPFET